MIKYKYIYSKEIANLIIKDYLNGYSLNELSKIYKLGSTTIGRILKRNNIVTRSKSECKIKYRPNHNFFKKIDSIEKSYIFGLLLSDGCNTINKKQIRISLQENDGYILEEMSKLMFSNTVPLNFHNRKKMGWKNQLSLTIRSEIISKDLEKLGMIHNKTHNLLYPKVYMDDSLFSGFLLGFFDGDGWFYIKKNGGGEFAICGTKQFIYGLYNEIFIRLGIKSYIYHKKNKLIYDLRIRKQCDLIKLYHFLYKKNICNLFLKRKKEKFEKYLQINNIL